ncbi:MAG: HAMP domain-containing histidine kinase [Chloroflexota bacterium]|nr:HAMP domain-containing histidine kinase [Chloroflexota bacterium]
MELYRDCALLVDGSRRLRVFNRAASETLGLGERDLGHRADEVLQLLSPDGERIAWSDVLMPAEEEAALPVRLQAPGRVVSGVLSATPIDRGAAPFVLYRFEETADAPDDGPGMEVLANVTHELRTPLSALVATTELLLQDYPSLEPDELGQMLSLLHRNTRRLESLVSNLLDAAAIQTGKFQLRKSVVYCQSLVRDAADFVLPLLNSKNQKLETRTVGVPPVLVVDPKRITGALVNLLSNASRYGPPNEKVQLMVTTEGTVVRFTVRQRGPSIPSHEQAMLFQRFYRTSAGSKVVGGSGLGLAIVKDVVEMHGGAVGIVSKPGKSTAFWFTLPIGGAPV